ncbi:MAG: carboxypeptidase regulatory-like domain-containing protein, partial [Thermoanaerobaculia bacterium]
MHVRALLLLLVLFVTLAPAGAQTTAALEGTVMMSEQPLAGATVTVSSPALIGTRSTTTTETGTYAFAALPPGDYRLEIQYQNLEPAMKLARLELARTTRADIVLNPRLAETVIVRETVPAVVNDPEVATTLSLDDIDKLPHQRNQLATAQLAPGVTANTLTNGQLQISGAPGYDNLVLVNGVVVTENTRNQIRPMYVEDAIVETTLLTGAIGAEYGRFTGGVVSTITKSGGEAWTGSLRDSLSNPSWSATSPANEAREDHLNHVWEATLGGAAIENRLWFFTAGRWAKNDTARQTIAVPAGSGNVPSTASPQLSYSESNDQKRYEAKLTGRITDAQSIVASYFGIDTQTENSRFANNIYDEASLTGRDEPESLLAVRYDAQLAERFLVEAQLSRREMSLSSGAFTRDLIGGTVLLDRSNSNARFGSPSLCAVCEDEQRDNQDILLKAHYFVGNAWGTHDLVAGADRFRERRFLEDHQSGSDFAV